MSDYHLFKGFWRTVNDPAGVAALGSERTASAIAREIRRAAKKTMQQYEAEQQIIRRPFSRIRSHVKPKAASFLIKANVR